MCKSTFSTAASLFVLLLILAACEAQDVDLDETAADTTAADTSASDMINALTSAEEGEGWEMLFTGDGFENWKGYRTDSIPGKWVVDDNAIHFDPDVEGSGGDLVTRDEYGSFELSFDWKIGECGNSGVIYLASESDDYEQLWNTGPEYQVLDNTCHPDAEVGTHRQAAANYDVNAPSEDLTRPAGEWNEARIVVDSTHVEHWLNGTRVVEYELGSEAWQQQIADSKWTDYPDYGTMRQGRIALQDHGNPVWFRNIKIREL